MTKAHGKMWMDPRTDIPDWVASGIGRVVVEFSELEWQFEDMIRILLLTDIASGRIVATGMNIRGRATCAKTLALNLKKGKKSKEIDNLWKRVEAIKSERDKLAHGTYGSIENDWWVSNTSGTRTLEEFNSISTARSLLAETTLITVDTFTEIRTRIKDASSQATLIRAKLREELPSQHISPEQHRQGPLPPHGLIE